MTVYNYSLEFVDTAKRDIQHLKKNEPQAYRKVVRLVTELRKHPRSGTGHPKQLVGDREGQWSRRITRKHRLVYKIEDDRVIVLVLSAWGHYDDK
ncbi:MAG: Txe/YoeB family addiction module toxin [Bacteroidales bacterium]|nr:Txe/YoeB family addiction module toxin [Bacteroidales bacterium]